MNRPEPQPSKAALDQLASYHWPGNMRELQNTVERDIILWREGPLTFDLPASPVHSNMVAPPKATANARLMTRDELKGLEREAISSRPTGGLGTERCRATARHEALDLGGAHLLLMYQP
jgi:DNA-binding NtrC family response regulator